MINLVILWLSRSQLDFYNLVQKCIWETCHLLFQSMHTGRGLANCVPRVISKEIKVRPVQFIQLPLEVYFELGHVVINSVVGWPLPFSLVNNFIQFGHQRGQILLCSYVQYVFVWVLKFSNDIVLNVAVVTVVYVRPGTSFWKKGFFCQHIVVKSLTWSVHLFHKMSIFRSNCEEWQFQEHIPQTSWKRCCRTFSQGQNILRTCRGHGALCSRKQRPAWRGDSHKM